MQEQGLALSRLKAAQYSPRDRWLPSETFDLATDCLKVLDLVVIFCLGWFVWQPSAPIGGAFLPERLLIPTVAALLGHLILGRGSLYLPLDLRRRRTNILRVGGAIAPLFASLIVFVLVVRPADPTTLTLFATWAVSVGGIMILVRVLTTAALRRLAAGGAVRDMVAIVGAGDLADRLIQRVTRLSSVPVEIVGIFDARASSARLKGSTAPIGTIEDLIKLAKERPLDHVFITLPWSADERLLQVLRKLKALAVDVSLCPDRLAFALPRRALAYGGGLPMLQLANRPLRRWQVVAKALEDKVLGALFLIMLAPLMLAIAAVIALDRGGPILFKQRRHGFNNTEIWVYKFRTMRSEVSDHAGARQTVRGDPRITRFGRFLRASSLDELPQLFNVLKGDMSLVGPRPHPIGMLTTDLLCDEIVEDYTHRHRVKPGITGWAQVNGYRGATETPEQLRLRVTYDLEYIENWSVLFDIKVIALTVFKVLRDNNAY